MPQHENVKLEFIQKDIFYIKPVIFQFVQKPSQDCALNKKCKHYIYLNNCKTFFQNS